jgi:hypothetical protein
MQARNQAVPAPANSKPRTVAERVMAPIRRATWRDWLYVLGQILFVASIELSDDALHALRPLGNAAAGIANAANVTHFEAAHGFWIEPSVQQFFAQTHHVLGQTVTWMQVRPLVNAMYGQGHVLITFCFAIWIFLYRRGLFDFIRNVFVMTNAMAVVLYESFPLAPPRLAPNLRYDGRHIHFLDPVFGAGGGLKLSFNEYAAMPSVHVGWALIVGVTLAISASFGVFRLLGIVYPIVMLTTVVVTGNHYISDGLGSMAVVLVSFAAALAFACLRQPEHSPRAVLTRLWRARSGDDESEEDDLFAFPLPFRRSRAA